MGQKVNPIGFRTTVKKDWSSRWYANKRDYGTLLHEDLTIRKIIKQRLQFAAVPRVNIERASNRIRVTIFTARPGIVIGRKGADIDKLRAELSLATGREVFLDILEVKTPELDAQLVAENVAIQLERRVSFRRAMKKALSTTMDFGALGMRIQAGGRLGGAELGRIESYREGKVPLQTLDANIDYGFAEAGTVYGKIGVKVWICRERGQDSTMAVRGRRPQTGGRGGRGPKGGGGRGGNRPGRGGQQRGGGAPRQDAQ
ncbi:MAG: 30S ribosomal protein S3 [Verrucomicrobiota bacterium]|nr:30S ribosomal protein S3 [Verrucomicrobiota bacterium]MDD8044845.1 30S ribosomal protein S3 [Verrucomicrobiota bacterium]MDD8049725.1 30S ribosomal protein S3 [Verrucomicrobiota bacterium]